MKKLACAIAVAGLIGTPAFAADMPVKAPPMAAAAPVFNWTGWYAGVNAGASFGNVKTDFNVGEIEYVQVVAGNVFVFDAPGSGVSDRSYPSGFIGDRKSVVWGKSVDLGGRRIIKKKKKDKRRRKRRV